MAIDTVNQQDADDLDRIYEQVMTCEPMIAKEQVDQLADMVFSKEDFIRQWRMTAFLAGEGGPFYADLAENEDKARALAPIAEILTDFSKMLHDMANMAKGASARIMVAGCNHENFTDWMKEGA